MRGLHLLISVTLLLGACATRGGIVGTSAVPLIPLEDFARQPETSSAVLAPAGGAVALIEAREGRGAILVLDLASGEKRLLYRDPVRSIGNVHWSPDGRWLFYLQDAGGDEGYHLFRLDPRASGPAPEDLTPFQGATVELVGQPRRSGSKIAISLNRRDPEFADGFLLDLATGEMTEVVHNDLGLTELFADDDARIGLATRIESDGSLAVFARDGHPGETASWRRVYAAAPAERLRVLQPGGANTALVVTNRGLPAQRLSRLDLASGRLTALGSESCGRFDEDGAVVGLDGEVWFRACTRIVPELLADGARARRQLDRVRALAGPEAGLSLESATADLSAVIVYAESATMPGQLIYSDGESARLVGETRPWLRSSDLAPAAAQWVSARDGLPLLTYVTRPRGAARPGPTVVALHGGPWSRDTGGFEATTQLLANRGYNVLQVNFRGSTGLGTRHFEAGVGQFGAAMSDDVVDAVQWAIGKGIADPARICVLGGSYGGYAALVAMSRDGALFACGIDYAGPADLVTLMEAFPPSWQPFLPRSWYRFVGDPKDPAARELMRGRSPLAHLEDLRKPMLIFQGANDPRVTQAQSDAIVCGLRQRGVAADYLLAGNEGHSFGNEETALAVNRATEQFLAAQLGGRAQASVDPRAEQALTAMRSAGSGIPCESGKAPAP